MASAHVSITQHPFYPAQPPRVDTWVPGWRRMFGERLRSVVYGIAEPAFDVWHHKMQMLNITGHIINAPDMIGHVLLQNQANYVRPKLTRQILKPIIGNGLLSAEGQDWRTQRKIVAPTFAPHAVADMAGLMAHSVARDMTLWPTSVARLDMAKVATGTTMTIIADSLFSGEPRLKSAAAGHHIDTVISAAGQPRFLRMVGLEHLDPSRAVARMRKSRRWLRNTVADIVRERGPDGGDIHNREDFFGGLMRALHADMPPDEANDRAVDNAITFYAAGHETTATALSWAIYLLAGQPTLQDQVRDEAQAALATGAISDIASRMPLMRAVVDETLRLYPSALQIIREAICDDDICGVPVRAGELTFVYPWVLHRHRKLWDNPDAFDLSRWTPANKAAQHRFQYVPFGVGPRICVGARFAITEAMIILAHWVANRRFILPDGFEPMPYGAVTLRPKHGMSLDVVPL